MSASDDPLLLPVVELGVPLAEDSEVERIPLVSTSDALGANLDSQADWRNLFQSTHVLGKLDYFAPRKSGAKVVVSPPDVAVEEGIDVWKASLVGQFLDKPLPFFLVKKICGSIVEAVW